MLVSAIQHPAVPSLSIENLGALAQRNGLAQDAFRKRRIEGLRCEIPSKINLYLEVLGRRPDGYHDLDTIMHAVDLTDLLEIYPSETSAIELCIDTSQAQQITGVNEQHTACDRAFDIPSDASNLIVRALESLRKALATSNPQHTPNPQQKSNPQLPGAKVILRKRIPAQAGLGGGSADAAAALVLGSLLWTGQVDFPCIRSLAAQLGSDLNFFLDGQSNLDGQSDHDGSLDRNSLHGWTARCTGRGECVVPLDIDLRLHGVIVHPREGCNTQAVFSRLRSDGALEGPRRTPDPLLEVLAVLSSAPPRTTLVNDWNQLGGLLYNRLDDAAKKTTAWVQRAAIRLDRYNPHGQCLSGSGSARFCLCSSREQADEIAEEILKEGDYRAYSVSSWRTPALTQQVNQVWISTE